MRSRTRQQEFPSYSSRLNWRSWRTSLGRRIATSRQNRDTPKERERARVTHAVEPDLDRIRSKLGDIHSSSCRCKCRAVRVRIGHIGCTARSKVGSDGAVRVSKNTGDVGRGRETSARRVSGLSMRRGRLRHPRTTDCEPSACRAIWLVDWRLIPSMMSISPWSGQFGPSNVDQLDAPDHGWLKTHASTLLARHCSHMACAAHQTPILSRARMRFSRAAWVHTAFRCKEQRKCCPLCLVSAPKPLIRENWPQQVQGDIAHPS